MPADDNGNVTRDRVERLMQDVKDLERKAEAQEETIKAMAITIAALQERLTIYNIAQGSFTTIAAAIATILGRMP